MRSIVLLKTISISSSITITPPDSMDSSSITRILRLPLTLQTASFIASVKAASEGDI
jgi:hypothetical protein